MKSLKELYRAGKGQSSYTPTEEVYPHNTFEEIKNYCKENKLSLTKYVEKFEGREIWVFFSEIWNAMRLTIANGLDTEGFITDTETRRKAKQLYEQNAVGESPEALEIRLVCACSFAASEESAAGEHVISIPSRSSCGVLPAVLLYMQEKNDFSDSEIIRAIAAAGIIGNIIKNNTTVFDDEEEQKSKLAAACAMSAAALAELHEMELEQVECASELALEYTSNDSTANKNNIESMIEKNAMAALRSINAMTLATFLTYTKTVSFDSAVRALKNL